MKEGSGLKDQPQLFAVAAHLGGVERFDCRAGLAVGIAKSREIMAPDQMRSGARHPLRVQRRSEGPDPPEV